MNAARTLLRFAPVLALVACASGAPFQPIPAQPPEKAVIYVYRPANLIGAGVVYTVMAGGRPLVKLEPGGYIALVEDARAMEFTAKTEAETSITLDLAAGETYYLKGGVGPGFVVGRPKLTLVDDTVGASEIQKCKKLGPASLGLATP